MTDRTMSAQEYDGYAEWVDFRCKDCKHYANPQLINPFCMYCTRFHIVKKGDLYEEQK